MKCLYDFSKMTNAELVDAARIFEREFEKYVPGLFAHELIAALRHRLVLALAILSQRLAANSNGGGK